MEREWNTDPTNGKQMEHKCQKGQQLDDIKRSHQIPPKACAAEELGESGPGDITREALTMQHTLLHSKLWSRRWPNVSSLINMIACAVSERPKEE